MSSGVHAVEVSLSLSPSSWHPLRLATKCLRSVGIRLVGGTSPGPGDIKMNETCFPTPILGGAGMTGTVRGPAVGRIAEVTLGENHHV